MGHALGSTELRICMNESQSGRYGVEKLLGEAHRAAVVEGS
jgi:hypothetical protein